MQNEDHDEGSGRRRWTALEKQEALAAYAASGQTQAAFCRERSLAVPTFSAWRRRALPPRGELIEVPRPGGGAVTIQLATGVSLAVEAGTEVGWLVQVVRALRCGA